MWGAHTENGRSHSTRVPFYNMATAAADVMVMIGRRSESVNVEQMAVAIGVTTE